MEKTWARFATDAHVLATRVEILQHKLPASLRAAAAVPYTHRRWDGAKYVETPTRARRRSLVLAVGQFWADNADDEVHLELAYSTRNAPAWPHTWPHDGPDPTHDATDLPLCGGADLVDDHDWGYGELVPAFEPWCHEGATQDDDLFDAYRPLAIARLDDAGRVRVELVSSLVRPWLDLPQDRAPALPFDDTIRALVAAYAEDPRALVALADALQQRGDPRGELIALAQHVAPAGEALLPMLAGADDGDLRSRHGELLAACGRAWLGSFDRFVPRSAVAYRGGLPAEIGLSLEPRADLDFDDPWPWALAPRVRFLASSHTPLVPGLARASSLGPLDDAAIEDLAALGIPFAAREVEVQPLSAENFVGLKPLARWMPHLRRLCLAGPAAGASCLGELAHFQGLTEVEIASPTHALDLPDELRTCVEARLPYPLTYSMFDGAAQCAAGWSATIFEGRARISHRGYLREADEAYLSALHRALAQLDLRIERVASPTWSPAAAALETAQPQPM